MIIHADKSLKATLLLYLEQVDRTLASADVAIVHLGRPHGRSYNHGADIQFALDQQDVRPVILIGRSPRIDYERIEGFEQFRFDSGDVVFLSLNGTIRDKLPDAVKQISRRV